MRNKPVLILLAASLLLCSCNIPSAVRKQPESSEQKFLWDLNTGRAAVVSGEQAAAGPQTESAAPTPQLLQPVDFEKAFTDAVSVSDAWFEPLPMGAGSFTASGGSPYAAESAPEGPEKSDSSIPPAAPSAAADTGSSAAVIDSAAWAFFDPAENTASAADTLYAAFDNTGSSTWNQDYYLEYYAGVDPSEMEKISLTAAAPPGTRAVFSIPLLNTSASWKSCWQLKNAEGRAFYDFCYSGAGGSGTSSAETVDVAAGVPGKEGYWAFQKTNGSAPARYSGSDLSAELVSTTPKDKYTFPAYDHFESLTVTFRNTGTETWDTSFSLIFYSGYNWMHQSRFSLPGGAAPGETVSVTMPMEIIEDNDKWVTCWYLAAPDGKNLYDFCFNYYTKG